MSDLESVGLFGDARRAERGAWMLDRIVSTGSVVIRRIGEDRAGEMAAHRFLSASDVTAAEITETVAARTGERCRGRRIVAAQDTTEINFSGRDRARTCRERTERGSRVRSSPTDRRRSARPRARIGGRHRR